MSASSRTGGQNPARPTDWLWVLIWVCAAGFGCRSKPAHKPPPAPAKSERLTVLTYNLNHERFDPSTVQAVVDSDADIAWLQEVTPAWEKALRQAVGGYSHIQFLYDGVEGGVAVLSRFPFTTLSWQRAAEGPFPAWCGRVSTGLGQLSVIAVHLHPPIDEFGLVSGYLTTDDERADEMKAHLSCFAEAPDLVVGSFNEDFGDAVRLVTERGLKQAQLMFPPVKDTWRWRTRVYDLSGRPDHVMYGPKLQPISVAVRVAGSSDHLPMKVAFVRAPLR